MKEEEDRVYGPYSLPEITRTQHGAYWDNESLREYYFSIPGEVYDRHPALFRHAMRFMQKNRDLKGEAHIYNKCVSSATNRAAREFVIPVLLGAAAIPIALEAAPVLWAIYTNPVTWLKMGASWSAQAMTVGIKDVDYFSVWAEGFTIAGSATSALIEYRPFSKEEPKLKIGFIDKSLEDTSVDIVVRALGAGFTRKIAGAAIKTFDGDFFTQRLMMGMGSGFYTFYQMTSISATEATKDVIKYEKENENVGRTK